jgi:hypothetical protein
MASGHVNRANRPNTWAANYDARDPPHACCKSPVEEECAEPNARPTAAPRPREGGALRRGGMAR